MPTGAILMQRIAMYMYGPKRQQCSHKLYIHYFTQRKWPVRTGIGRTQPALDGRRP